MEQTRDDNKSKFVSNSTPTQQDFADVFDSFNNIPDDGSFKWFKTTHSFTELNGTFDNNTVIASGSVPSGFIPVAFQQRTITTFTTSGSLTGLNTALYTTAFVSAKQSDVAVLPLYADPYLWIYGQADPSLSNTYAYPGHAFTGKGSVYYQGDPIDLRIYVESVGDDLNTLTDGEFEWWVLCYKLPTNPVVLFP